jgi:hypothetical protein
VTPVARNVWSGVAADVAVRLWSSCRVAHERVKRNVNPRLAIEVFLGDVAFAARRAPVVESTDPPFHRPVLV